MSNNGNNAAGGIAKTYPPQDFGRKLSGRKFLLVCGILTVTTIIGVELFKQMSWSAYLNRVEPREYFATIIKDLRKYQKRSKELPIDLSIAAKQKWKWVSEEESTVFKFKDKQNKNAIVSKFHFRQYEYLYARIDENTGVLWAVPTWKEAKPEVWWTNMFTNHNELIKDQLIDWKKEKPTWFVVLYQDHVRAWSANLPPNDKGTTGLENNLEPSSEWLENRNLVETKAEKWIGKDVRK